jgi:hypothetical protein
VKFFEGTQAQIEALASPLEGMECYATDLDAFGYYDGSSWHWYSAVDGVTRTVGSGKDHATIQDAVDWFKKKLVTGSCKIDVDAGSYDEAVVFDDLFIGANGALELEGDTRVLAGLSLVDGATMNQAGLANGGSGVCALANAGNNITVTGTVTNPDFDADGWGSGDTILVYDNVAATTEYTISSTLNNVITLTVAAPAVGNDATTICLLPDRHIERTTAGPCVSVEIENVKLDGFFLISSVGADCNGVQAINGGSVECENVATQVQDYGFYADNLGMLIGDAGAISAWDSTMGVITTHSSVAKVQYVVVVNCTYGCYGGTFSLLHAPYGIYVNGTYGVFVTNFAHIYADNGTARQDTNTGYYAQYMSFIRGVSTNANNNGNGADYNPAPGIPGSAQGNHFAVIYAS